MITCLLCNSTDVKEITKISSKEIAKKYIENYNADFSYLLKDADIQLMECSSCNLRFYNPQIAGDENFYKILQQYDWYYREEKEEYNYASQFIKQDDVVLDVGCGKGEFKNFIASACFTGLEFSLDAVEAGRKNGCNIIQQSVEEHAELFPGKYDVVATFQVLEHVKNVSKFIQSCAKCVRPGGKLIISVPSENSYIQFSRNNILNMPPHHISRWPDKTLITIAEIIDFTLFQLHHDKIDRLHLNSYFVELAERMLPFKNRYYRLIDNSFSFKIRMKIARVLARKISKDLSNSAWQGIGQNVTVVYQKAN